METLSERNAIIPEGSKFKYGQLFNFHYSDGAKMLTLGGIFYNEGELKKVEKCRFFDSPFIKDGEDPYLIDVPNLTYREVRYLDTQLPSSNLDELKLPGIPNEEIKKYARNYRYFPNFSETEM
jgi:hypothetical protein